MSPSEQGLMDALLAEEFPGRDELRVQAKDAKVRPLDEEGSLEFQGDGPAAPVLDTCPVDAIAADSDGVVLNAFLHVEEGRLKELEIVKVDGTPLRRMPDAKAWKVVAFG